MNKNQKEKPARMEIQVSQKNKAQIQSIAHQCGLSASEYILQRALGYSPKQVTPDAFFLFYQRLCELLNLSLPRK